MSDIEVQIVQKTHKDEQCDVFIINEQVIFDAKEHVLKTVASGKCITLYSTSSECLSLLIRGQGKVISQRELMTVIWSEKNRDINANAFYQMLLTLRRALERAGAGSNIILTVKRKGLLIDESTAIEWKKRDVTKPEPSITYSDHINIVNQHEMPIEINHNSSVADNFSTDETGISKTPTKMVKTKLRPIIILGLSAVISAGIFYTFISSKKESGYFRHYNSTQKIDDCTFVYMNDSYSNKSLSNIITDIGLDCSLSKFIYLTSLSSAPQESIIICSVPVTASHANMCTSYFYLDRNHAS